MDQEFRDSAIIEGNLRDFFGKLLNSASEKRRAKISPHALTYVTELLVAFHETARLFAQQNVKVPVLADMLSDAVEADFHRRVTILQRLGDTSLMVSGFFPEVLNRKSIDLDYYQRMGEIAYSHLSSLREDVQVFDELSQKFYHLSDLIHEVADGFSSKDYSVFRLIEFYMESGSARVFEKLKRQGIFPLRPGRK